MKNKSLAKFLKKIKKFLLYYRGILLLTIFFLFSLGGLVLLLVLQKNFKEYYFQEITQGKSHLSEVTKKIETFQSRLRDPKELDRDELENLFKNRKLDRPIPKDWKRFESDYLSFSYPEEDFFLRDKYLENSKVVYLEYQTRPELEKEWTFDNWDKEIWSSQASLGFETIISIQVENSPFSHQVSILKRGLHWSWKDKYNASLIRHGTYQLEDKEFFATYLDIFETDISNSKTYNPAYPYGSYHLVHKGKNNLYLITATKRHQQDPEEFAKLVETILASLEEGDTVQPYYQKFYQPYQENNPRPNPNLFPNPRGQAPIQTTLFSRKLL